jgi:uncharacterized protein YggE
MKYLIIASSILLIAIKSFSQVNALGHEKSYIEIDGSADTLVVPDMIYLKIEIDERMDGKTKISIEDQEEEMKKTLIASGINLEDLSLSDANTDIVQVKWKKQVLSRSNYLLKVASAKEVAMVFEKLNEIKINDIYIEKVHHTKYDEIVKEIEIKAIKHAKHKADYLLHAIGETTGKSLIIKESTTTPYPYPLLRTMATPNIIAYDENGNSVVKNERLDIQFSKIKIISNIYVKFEVK